MSRRGRARPPWWAWPSLLGIDAPVVAVAWAWTLARTAGASFGVAEAVAVAGGTAAAYLADRARDARRLDGRRTPTLRHAFAARHPRLIIGLAASSALFAVAVTPWLATATLVAGVFVAVATALLLIAARSGRGATIEVTTGSGVRSAAWRPWAVGGLFAAGVMTPVTEAGLTATASLTPVAIGLGLVATLNVAMIAGWEHHLDDGAAPCAARPGSVRVRAGLALVVAIASWIARPWLTGLGPSLAVAAAALALLDLTSSVASPAVVAELRHSAADAVLVIALLAAALL